mmetsp:Transcript_137798/g.274780  ORF Transcript_137798/g.274780 Transcript_137798/m.274780 type:complete len:92 (-) Transcript_137798:303-578(-)
MSPQKLKASMAESNGAANDPGVGRRPAERMNIRTGGRVVPVHSGRSIAKRSHSPHGPPKRRVLSPQAVPRISSEAKRRCSSENREVAAPCS